MQLLVTAASPAVKPSRLLTYRRHRERQEGKRDAGEVGDDAEALGRHQADLRDAKGHHDHGRADQVAVQLDEAVRGLDQRVLHNLAPSATVPPPTGPRRSSGNGSRSSGPPGRTLRTGRAGT